MIAVLGYRGTAGCRLGIPGRLYQNLLPLVSPPAAANEARGCKRSVSAWFEVLAFVILGNVAFSLMQARKALYPRAITLALL